MKKTNSKNTKSNGSSIRSSSTPQKREVLVLPPPQEAHTNIVKNLNVDSYLYLELYNNLTQKDDVKALAICRLILAQDPENKKIQELNDLLFEGLKQKNSIEKEEDEGEMDKHMKLNKDGEYEYMSSDEEK